MPQYTDQVRKTREPGNLVPRRRVNWRKRLARAAFAFLVLIILTVLGGMFYALSLMAVAAVAGLMDALG